MGKSFELLKNKVEPLASNPIYSKSLSILLTKGLNMLLDEVIEVPYSDSPEIRCFRNLIIFLRYLAEGPKGISYEFLKDEYVYLLNHLSHDCKAEVVPFLTSIYLGALSTELHAADISDLKVWLGICEFLKSKNVETQQFEQNLKTKISSKLLEVIGRSEKDIKMCIECVSISVYAQNLGINLSDIINLFADTIYQYLNLKYKRNKCEETILEDIKNLVYVMKSLQFESNLERNQVNELEKFFGATSIKHRQVNQELEEDSNIFEPKIDFSTLTYVSTVYFNSNNPNIDVYMYHYVCAERGDIALKMYEIKNPDFSRNNIENEIYILKTLSKHITHSDCFLKFYGSYCDQNKIYISMEYSKDNLMSKLSEMKFNKQSFNETHMIYYAHKLISAYSIMEQLGIYHQDINPNNILVTPDWGLKIVNFSESISKFYDERKLTGTDNYSNQGYMAPELQAHQLSGHGTQIKYERGKADVFSLGLVLLQMYTLEELQTLKMRDNNHLLMRILEKLPFPCFQALLKNMLQVDCKMRVSFKKALNYVPGR